MKIYVNNIPREGLKVEEEFNARGLSFEDLQIHYLSPIKVSAFAKKDKDIVIVDCNITTVIKKKCAKCLKELEEVFEKQAQFIYTLEGQYAIELDNNLMQCLHQMLLLQKSLNRV